MQADPEVLKEAEVRAMKAKVTLQFSTPFFAVPVMHCTLTPDIFTPTASVDRHGNIKYNPVWILTLTDMQIAGLWCHEVMHVMFMHLIYHIDRVAAWGVAEDIKINNIIVTSTNYDIPACGYIPKDNKIRIKHLNDYLVTDLDKKTVEDIFEEILPLCDKKQDMELAGDVPGERGRGGAEDGMVTDIHIRTAEPGVPDKDAEDMSDKEKAEAEGAIQALETKWKGIMATAVTLARRQGNMPAGLDMMIDDILDPKIDWREYLRRYISDRIPYDFTWMHRSRKSAALGLYLPSTTGELLEVIVHWDSSGSTMSMAGEFLTEITSILGCFDNVKLTLVVVDCALQGVYDLTEADIEGIMEAVGGKIKGGGGTSHKPAVEWVKEHAPDAKVFITFTDGYSDMEECLPGLGIPILSALTENHSTPNNFDTFSEVVVIK